MDKKLFTSYSRNLNAFLKGEGVFPVSEGVHKTGVNISADDGTTWEDYTSVFKALDVHYDSFQRKELEDFRELSFTNGAPVLSGKISPETGKEILVRKRVRYYKVFESTDRLQVALTRWKESGPKK